MSFKTKALMNDYDKNSLPSGMLSYCLEDNKYYSFNGTEWKELSLDSLKISADPANKATLKADGLFVDAVSNTELTTKLADYTTTADLTTKLTAKVDTTALETYKQEVTASLSNKVEQTALTTTLEQYLKKDQIGQVGGGITATWAEDTKTFTLKGITLAQI